MEILSELGQPGSLYFIKEKDSDGNPNYGLDTSGHYVLAKDIEELKEEGSVVLNGTDVKSAKSWCLSGSDKWSQRKMW